MKQYKIIIDGEEVQLYQTVDRSIAITKMIASFSDITARKKDNTKTITVPGTGTNRRLLKYAEDINSVIEQTQTKPTLRIEADGEVLFIGNCRVTIATIPGNSEFPEFEIIATGGNADWIERMNGKYLHDLDYSDQDHERSESVVNASEVVGGGREYVYDLIDRGKFSGQLDANGKETVQLYDRYPAITNKSLFVRSFNDIGYRVVSNFIDSAFFESTYFPFVNEYMKHPLSVNDTYRMSCYSLELRKPTTLPAIVQMTFGNTQFVAPYYNTGNNMNAITQGRYLCKGGRGKYTFTFRVDYRSTGNVYVSNVGGTVYTYTANVVATFKKINRYNSNTPVVCSFDSSYVDELPANTNGNNWNTLRTIEFTKTFELEWGDEVFVEVEMNQYRDGVPLQSSYYTTQSNQGPCDIYYSELSCDKVEGHLEMGEYQTVFMNENLPENVLQLHFIQSMKELFNLHFVTDVDARTVYIEPWEDFYTHPVEDWSDKVDLSKDRTILFAGSDLAKLIRYKYKQDPMDKFVEAYNNQNSLEYGAYEADVDNVQAKKDVEVLDNTLLAPTWMDNGARFGCGTTMFPKMWSDVSLPAKSSKFAPRILVYKGRTNLPSGETYRQNTIGLWQYQQDNPSNTYRTVFPKFQFYNNTEANDDNLSFADNDYSYGLFNKYWRHSHAIKSDGRKVNYYIWLKDNDVANVNFRAQKYIEINGNGAYFILERIENYKSQDMESTLCELVKVTGRKKLGKLNYQQAGFTNPIIVFGSPFIPGSISYDGQKLMAGGDVIMQRRADGTFRAAEGETVYAEVNGIIVPVLYTDSKNNYQEVKTT